MNVRYVVDLKGKIQQVLLSIKDYEQLLVRAKDTEALAKLRRMKKEMPNLMGLGKKK
jgi:hypothetical protein